MTRRKRARTSARHPLSKAGMTPVPSALSAAPTFHLYRGEAREVESFQPSGENRPADQGSALGFGYVFAQNPKAAEDWRATLCDKMHQYRGRHGKMDINDPLDVAEHMLSMQPLGETGKLQACTLLQTAIDNRRNADRPEMIRVWQAAIEAIYAGSVKVPHAGGHVYQVEVASTPERFLDWRFEASRQSVFVQAALSNLGVCVETDRRSGGEIYGGLTRHHARQAMDQRRAGKGVKNLPSASELTSDQMRAVGIDGVRYPDNLSHNGVDGGRLLDLHQDVPSGKWVASVESRCFQFGSPELHTVKRENRLLASREAAERWIEENTRRQSFNFSVFSLEIVRVTHLDNEPVQTFSSAEQAAVDRVMRGYGFGADEPVSVEEEQFAVGLAA